MSTNVQTRMTIIIGTNGTGKSTLVRQIVNGINLPRKLIITRQLDEWDECPQNNLVAREDFLFKGIQRHIPTDVNQTLDRLHYLRRCAVVFDDARKYLKAKTDDELNALYISRRQYAMHIIFVAHSFDQVPIQAYSFATDFILFRTSKPIDKGRLNQLNDPEKFEETKRRVDQEAKTNPYYFERIIA